MQQLLIIGCPRSGTTLLHQLIGACFEETWIPSHAFECAPTDPAALVELADRPPPAPPWAVYKYPHFYQQQPDAFRQYVTFGGHVLVVLRDPRSVVTSTATPGGRLYYPEVPGLTRAPLILWLETLHLLEDLAAGDTRRQTQWIRFEDLVRSPDAAQRGLTKVYGWTPTHLFSTAHEVLRPPEDATTAMKGARPMDAQRTEHAPDDVLWRRGVFDDPRLVRGARAFYDFPIPPRPEGHTRRPIELSRARLGSIYGMVTS